MLPRRCKKCRCYIAPHLTKCPRCGKSSPSNVVSKPTKEDRAVERAKMDAKVPVIQGKSIHWIPTEFSLRVHQEKLKELDRLLAKADGSRARNAIRSEIRSTKAHLARKQVPSGKKGWTTDKVVARHAYVTVFISPKKNRYVLAARDGPADLIVVPASKKHRRGTETIRLQRLEKSVHMKTIRKQEKEAADHTTRRKHKKAHRATKRLAKRTAE